MLSVQVMGRALFAGAGLFEMAAAAGASLAGASSGGAPVLANAAITSPCQLSASGAASQKLTCLVHLRCVRRSACTQLFLYHVETPGDLTSIFGNLQSL